MPIEPWSVQDVLGWTKINEETKGKRVKFWVRGSDGALWLRKQPRVSRPYEPAIETFTLRLAAAAGLAAPAVLPCVWRESDVEQRGIVVRSFLDAGTFESLATGAEALRGVFSEYNPELRGEHTLERVREALQQSERREPGVELVKPFVDMLVLDLWIGNSDRHQENWGLALSPHGIRLAAVFDTAACLGAELQPPQADRLLSRGDALDAYVLRCPSGFGAGGRALVPMARVLETVRAWPEWQNSRRLLRVFEDLLSSEVPPYLENVQEDWLPEPRRRLARMILERRLAWLSRHG